MADIYLMGDETSEDTADKDNTRIYLSKFTCITGGTVNQLGVFHSATGGGDHVKVCMYADSAGEPGAYILDTGEETAAVGWNYYAVTPTVIVKDTVYWLGYKAGTSYRICRHTAAGTTREKTATYADAFADPAGSGFSAVTTRVWEVVALGTATATGNPHYYYAQQ